VFRRERAVRQLETIDKIEARCADNRVRITADREGAGDRQRLGDWGYTDLRQRLASKESMHLQYERQRLDGEESMHLQYERQGQLRRRGALPQIDSEKPFPRGQRPYALPHGAEARYSVGASHTFATPLARRACHSEYICSSKRISLNHASKRLSSSSVQLCRTLDSEF
jgi:hypothetical protein